MCAFQKRKRGNSIAAAPCQDYPKADHTSVCRVAPQRVAKQEKEAGTPQNPSARQSREKEPEPGAGRGLQLLMFRDQKRANQKPRTRRRELLTLPSRAFSACASRGWSSSLAAIVQSICTLGPEEVALTSARRAVTARAKAYRLCVPGADSPKPATGLPVSPPMRMRGSISISPRTGTP
jgi:hypothetical protein